jgi:hypothetical protein
MPQGRSYKPPTFPISAVIYTGQNFVPASARLLVSCNLAVGRSVQVQGWFPLDGSDSLFTKALFPRGTDVRDRFSEGGADGIECPILSNRFYVVLAVIDVGSGFSNEYRMAVLAKTGTWPTPLPPVWVPPAEVVVESDEELRLKYPLLFPPCDRNGLDAPQGSV